MTGVLRVLVVTALGLGLASVGLACGDDEPEPENTLAACEPLTAKEQPIELGDVIAVGRGADETLYVIDEQDGQARAFVSEDGGPLQRVPVSGEGSGSGEPVEFREVTVDVEPPYILYFESSADMTRFLRIDSTERVVPGAVPDDGEELELSSADDIADLGVRNLPPKVTVEYFERLPDGRRVVVLRPEVDWSYDDFRVFFGSARRMFEQTVKNVSRARDGGSTTIEFEFDGKPATLSFPIEQQDDGGIGPGQGTLELDGDTLELERLDPANKDDAATLKSLLFFCS